jgi:hypothetical protein
MSDDAREAERRRIDVAVCIRCAGLALYVGRERRRLRLRKLDAGELRELMADPELAAELLRMQAAVRKVDDIIDNEA